MKVTISAELAETILAQLSRRIPDEDAVQAMIALQNALKGTTKEGIMALDLATLESEVKSAVAEATSVVDQADKFADILASHADDIPGAGPDVQKYVGWLDTATKTLNELNAAAQGI